MPMTHLPEIGAKNRYRKAAQVSDASDMQLATEIFWYLCLLTNRTYCIFALVYGTSFYRATRMHSADYAVAKRLSVRLSVDLTRRYCV